MPTNPQAPQYPFDPTGTATTNLVTNEQQALNPPTYEDFHFLIPFAAPYFATSLSVSIQPPTGPSRDLVEGIDYYCTFQFIDASRQCASPVYGAVSFIDNSLVGIVSFSYQTVGGDWTIDLNQIAVLLAQTLYNPRITSWDQVTEYPARFPPVDHSWDLVDLTGAADVVTAINGITNAILQQVFDQTAMNEATDTANAALQAATNAEAIANGALSIASALDPEVAQQALTALQTAISLAQGGISNELSQQITQALNTANEALAAVNALSATPSSSPGASDDLTYFTGQF
jgi:hypothetical protein